MLSILDIWKHGFLKRLIEVEYEFHITLSKFSSSGYESSKSNDYSTIVSSQNQFRKMISFYQSLVKICNFFFHINILIPTVDCKMRTEIFFLIESFFANTTNKRTLSGVNPSVSVKFGHVTKDFVAILARILEFPWMSFFVLFHLTWETAIIRCRKRARFVFFLVGHTAL